MSNLENISARANAAAGALRGGSEAGPQVNEIMRDLQSASMAELEEHRGAIVHAMNLLGGRGARITSWLVAQATESDRKAFWENVTVGNALVA